MDRRAVLGATLLCLAACSREVVISIPTPTISVLPDALDFGEVVAADQVGAEPENQQATAPLFVENTGRADLVWALTLDGDGLAVLDPVTAEAVTTLGGTLEPGDDLTLDVAFAPPTLGDAAATLVVTSNDPDRPAVEVPLTGVGRVPFAPDIELDRLVIDFGTVELDEVAQEVLTIRNTGDAVLTLGTLTQNGAGTFRIDRDPSGTRLLPGASLPVLVEFEPIQTGGDSGQLTVRSDDADEPEVDVDLLANGGGNFEYPEAVITGCPETADVSDPVTVTLSGADSLPLGTAFTYQWAMVRRPDAGDAGNLPTPTDGEETQFVVDAAGIWEITLIVVDDAGRPSVPAKCVIDATPIDDVYVELSWAGP
ncbi:MAG: choice-of-anchor D domain-containing protein, partial [Myxococcota bacterium]